MKRTHQKMSLQELDCFSPLKDFMKLLTEFWRMCELGRPLGLFPGSSLCARRALISPSESPVGYTTLMLGLLGTPMLGTPMLGLLGLN